MFEAITFSIYDKHDTNNPLDIGWLVECMLFYERVTVVANQDILKQLIKYFGVENLLILIEEDLLSVIYTESQVGIITNTVNNIQYHEILEFSSPQHTYQDEIRRICIDTAGKPGRGRRLSQKIQDKIQVITKHDSIILKGTRQSFLNQTYIEAAAKLIIKELVPEVGNVSQVLFHTVNTPNGVQIVTNVDFQALNHLYHKTISPKHSSLSPAYILVHLLGMERELYFSSSRLSELASSGLSAKLAEQKIDYVISRSMKSSETLKNFTGLIFNNSKAVREAVNANRIDLVDLISVLRKSKEFKKWIVGVKPEEDLIKSYYEEVTKKTFVDKLPGKSIRWGIFTGLGLAADTVATGGFGTIAGITIGALDTFYVDKLISGWKPNQFIEQDVKKLIKEDT
jgi:hypothetical protein